MKGLLFFLLLLVAQPFCAFVSADQLPFGSTLTPMNSMDDVVKQVKLLQQALKSPYQMGPPTVYLFAYASVSSKAPTPLPPGMSDSRFMCGWEAADDKVLLMSDAYHNLSTAFSIQKCIDPRFYVIYPDRVVER